ncbi:MAG: YNFM family putative membrane transporter [Haloarculaceae archaeon]
MQESNSQTAVLGSAVAANFGQFGARVAISPFVLVIATEFGRSKGEIGIVLTLMWAIYACFQFPSGVFADRYGERRIILAALGLATAGGLLVAWSPSFLAFALAALVLGSGAGMYFAAGTALLDRRFENTGQAFSIHSAGGPLAGLVVPVGASLVAGYYNWQAGILVGAGTVGAAFVFVALAVGATPPASPSARIRDRLTPGTVFELLSRPPVAFMTVLGVIGMYVFQSFVSFFPAFLQEYHGLSTGEASLGAGVAFVLIAAVLPLVGRAGDAYGLDYFLLVPFLVTAAGFGILLVPGSLLVLGVGVVLVGVGLTWGGVIQSRFMREFADDERGTGFGLVRTTFVLLGSIGNAATGFIAELGGWPIAIGVLVCLLVVAAAMVVGNRVLGVGL